MKKYHRIWNFCAGGDGWRKNMKNARRAPSSGWCMRNVDGPFYQVCRFKWHLKRVEQTGFCSAFHGNRLASFLVFVIRCLRWRFIAAFHWTCPHYIFSPVQYCQMTSETLVAFNKCTLCLFLCGLLLISFFILCICFLTVNKSVWFNHGIEEEGVISPKRIGKWIHSRIFRVPFFLHSDSK